MSILKGFCQDSVYFLDVDPGGYIHSRIRIINSIGKYQISMGQTSEYPNLGKFLEEWELISYQDEYVVGSNKQEVFLTLEAKFTQTIRDNRIKELLK